MGNGMVTSSESNQGSAAQETTPKQAADSSGPPASQDSSTSEPSKLITGFVSWVAAVTFFAFSSETSRSFIVEWWWAILGALVGFALLLLIPAVRGWLKQQGSVRRAGLFTFVGMPLLLLFVGSVVVLPERHQPTALRVVFLLVLCLLPATMWYLFIATRKASLLNEFLSRLDRLGLLTSAPGGAEEDLSRDRRVFSYLQKFEALYGTLPESIHRDIQENRLNVYSRAEATSPTVTTPTVPVIMSTVLIALGWLITLSPSGVPTTGDSLWGRAFEPAATPITFAFLGAYFFSLQMLFRRYILKDLRGSAYVAVTLRIILAVIAVWVITAVSGVLHLPSPQSLMVTAFVIGFLPRVFWQVLEGLFRRMTKVVVPSMVSELPVSDLDGLTVWHEARLEEEDIENIPNMATTDLVELMLNTRFPSERIIDWTDQAILFSQLGAEGTRADESGQSARQKLRAHGIRTATSLLEAAAAAKRQGQREVFDKILVDRSGVSVMPSLEAVLGMNSNLELIRRWRGMSHEAGPPVPIGAPIEAGRLAQMTAEPLTVVPAPDTPHARTHAGSASTGS